MKPFSHLPHIRKELEKIKKQLLEKSEVSSPVKEINSKKATNTTKKDVKVKAVIQEENDDF